MHCQNIIQPRCLESPFNAKLDSNVLRKKHLFGLVNCYHNDNLLEVSYRTVLIVFKSFMVYKVIYSEREQVNMPTQ
jgi:hypothetical protein